MIFDSFSNPLNNIKYPKVITDTIEYMKTLDISALKPGKYQIDGDNIFFNVDSYETFLPKERIVEAHKEYIDIQFLISGSEKIGFSHFSNKNVIKTPYSIEKDLLVYESIENEFDLILTPGVFVIFFPEEPHRPCCINKNKELVKKVVVKIKKCCI